MLHTTSLSFIFSKTLYARDVKELIPTHGIDEKSQKAFVVAIPIRKPVKEPGPISQVINSISFKLKLVWLKAFSIIGIKFSECVRPVLVSRLIISQIPLIFNRIEATREGCFFLLCVPEFAIIRLSYQLLLEGKLCYGIAEPSSSKYASDG